MQIILKKDTSFWKKVVYLLERYLGRPQLRKTIFKPFTEREHKTKQNDI